MMPEGEKPPQLFISGKIPDIQKTGAMALNFLPWPRPKLTDSSVNLFYLQYPVRRQSQPSFH